MAKKKKHKSRIREVEVVNITTRKRKVIVLGDDRVIFDEKTGRHRVLPTKKSTYVTNDVKEEEE